MDNKTLNTRYSKIMHLLSTGMLAGVFIYLLFFWNRIPDKIPTHYNASGEIDSWSGKQELWIFFIVAAVLYVIITILERLPKIWNTGVTTVTEENREGVYRELKNMIVTLKLIMVFTFLFLIVCSSLCRPLPSVFLLLELGAVFGALIFFIVRVNMAGKKGSD